MSASKHRRSSWMDVPSIKKENEPRPPSRPRMMLNLCDTGEDDEEDNTWDCLLCSFKNSSFTSSCARCSSNKQTQDLVRSSRSGRSGEEADSLAADLDKVTAERNNYQTELSELGEKFEKILGEKNQFENDIVFYKDLYEFEQKKLGEVSVELKNEKSKMQKMLDAAKDEAVGSADSRKKQAQVFAETEAGLNKKIDELTATAEEEKRLKMASEVKVEDLERELTAMNAHLIASQNQADAKFTKGQQEWSESKNDLTAQVDQLTEKEAESQISIKTLQTDKESLQTDVDELRKGLENIKEVEVKHLVEEVSDLRSTNEKTSRQVEELKSELATVTTNLADADEFAKNQYNTYMEEITSLQKQRRAMHEVIADLRGNVRVFARVRPFLPHDNAPQDGKPSLEVSHDHGSLGVIQNGTPSHSFNYDYCFSPADGQEQVFEQVSDFVQSALDGYNVCLFSYGQTGAGKTHSMQGSGAGPQRGIIPRAIEQLAKAKVEMEDQGWVFETHVSFIEIYCEKVKDLLQKSNAPAQQHKIITNDFGQNIVSNTVMEILDPSDNEKLSAIMATAAAARTTKKTEMNAESSRSHSVFTLHITAINSRVGVNLHGQLNLVDLAGSEKVNKSGVTGQELVEANNINKSLSSLADVFDAISKKQKFVPFRNSQLTFLLERALSGSGKTLMMLNLSPTDASVPESLSSLRFGSKVNACELGRAQRSYGHSEGKEDGSSKTQKGKEDGSSKTQKGKEDGSKTKKVKEDGSKTKKAKEDGSKTKKVKKSSSKK